MKVLLVAVVLLAAAATLPARAGQDQDTDESEVARSTLDALEDETPADVEGPPPRRGRPDVDPVPLPPYLERMLERVNRVQTKIPFVRRAGLKRPDPAQHRFGVVAWPTLSYSTDEGLGGTLLLGLNHRQGNEDPTLNNLSLSLRGTTELVQRYELRWRSQNPFGLPVRTWVHGGLYSTVNDNFCGFGNHVTCSMSEAEAKADAAGLVEDSEAREDFLRHYYRRRYMRPFATANAWWRVMRAPFKVEVMTGVRASYYIPGDYFYRGPYPGSLYAEVFPDGEEGLTLTPQIGITIDSRDLEAAPTRGLLFESTVRAASTYLGSRWSYTGFMTSLAGYHQLKRNPRVVFAGRVLTDFLFGDVPSMEQATIGGAIEVNAFGGRIVGRGIRAGRYAGKLKVIGQAEVRADLYHIVIWRQNIDLGGAFFVDTAFIGADWDDLAGGIPGRPLDDQNRGNPLMLIGSAGAGLRFLVNDSFVARFDVAISPFEQRGPGISSGGGNPF